MRGEKENPERLFAGDAANADRRSVQFAIIAARLCKPFSRVLPSANQLGTKPGQTGALRNMGTRALTVIKESDGREICTIYRQYDGYPGGLGDDLKRILSAGPLVNGIQGSRPCFNGMGDLAAQVIANLKIKDGKITVGNVYVHPPDTRDCGEEYIYTIYSKDGKIQIKCEAGAVTFFGMPGTKQNHMLCLSDGPAGEFDSALCDKRLTEARDEIPNDFLESKQPLRS